VLLFIHLNNAFPTFPNVSEAKCYYRFTGVVSRDSSWVFKPFIPNYSL